MALRVNIRFPCKQSNHMCQCMNPKAPLYVRCEVSGHLASVVHRGKSRGERQREETAKGLPTRLMSGSNPRPAAKNRIGIYSSSTNRGRKHYINPEAPIGQ